MKGRKGAQKKPFDSKNLFWQNFVNRDPVMDLKVWKVDLKGSASGNDELRVSVKFAPLSQRTSGEKILFEGTGLLKGQWKIRMPDLKGIAREEQPSIWEPLSLGASADSGRGAWQVEKLNFELLVFWK